MYCTGGIRCEKATAYFKYRGFDNLYQVDGGIIEYARKAQELGLENKFIGKNFVFDERLGERISDDIIAHCHQCGTPCDHHTNCANEACHILFIQCPQCQSHYQGCCTEKCSDFIKLPEEEREQLRGSMQFNGTKFGKGRYKAAKDGSLMAHPSPKLLNKSSRSDACDFFEHLGIISYRIKTRPISGLCHTIPQ